MKTSVTRWAIRGACVLGVAGVAAITLPRILIPENHGISKARDAAIAEDTKVVHDAFVSYTKDHGHEPKCLDELVRSGYLKSIPKDFLPKANEMGLSEHCQ